MRQERERLWCFGDPLPFQRELQKQVGSLLPSHALGPSCSGPGRGTSPPPQRHEGACTHTDCMGSSRHNVWTYNLNCVGDGQTACSMVLGSPKESSAGMDDLQGVAAGERSWTGFELQGRWAGHPRIRGGEGPRPTPSGALRGIGDALHLECGGDHTIVYIYPNSSDFKMGSFYCV